MSAVPSPAETGMAHEQVRLLICNAGNAVVAEMAAQVVLRHTPELTAWAADELTRKGFSAAAHRLTPAPETVLLTPPVASPLQEPETASTPSSAPAMPLPEAERQTALAAAQWLHGLGLNVFPQPLGCKSGNHWKDMQHTRLLAADLPAVFAGRCNIAVLTGRTSGNLFVLDCESSAAFDRAQAEVRARGIPLWAVESARGGHIWLRSSSGPVKSVAAGRIPAIEVRGQNGYVLAPPSIHPSGAVYTWVAREGDTPPVVDPAVIDFLCDADGRPVMLEANRPAHGKPRLNRRTRAYLEHGHNLSEGQRHQEFFQACCNYRDCGLTRADMERDLVPIARASGLTSAQDRRKQNDAMQWAEERVTPKTRARRTALPDPDALEWSGRTARTDCAVFTALIERAALGSYERGEFRATWRELMPLAGVADYHTLQRALKRLQKRGLVKRVGTDRGSGGALWRFEEAALAGFTDSLSLSLSKNSTATAPAECAQITALGITQPEDSSAVDYALFSPSERRILKAVITAGQPLRTRSAIAQAAGLETGAVANALRAGGPLRTLGAIIKTGGVWQAGEIDVLALQERADKAEAKRRRVKQSGDRERAKWAARRLIAWRVRRDSAHYFSDP